MAANVSRPQVAYKESIRRVMAGEGKFVRQSGGRGQYGHVKLRLEPLKRGEGFVFENAIVGGVVPREYISAVESGIVEAMQHGILAGYPVVDMKATLYDGSYHEVDSSELAFKIAASMAFKEAAKKAEPVILEPIMNVEVVVPDEYMGDVIGDLNASSRQDPWDGRSGWGQSSGRACAPWQRCLGMPQICVHGRKGARHLPCSLLSMMTFRRTNKLNCLRHMKL